MEKIFVEIWGGEFFFDPKEVKLAETPGEILETLKHENGNKPYSPMRCALLAQRPEGKKIITEIRRICEEGRDKKKGKREIRKATDSLD